MVTGHSMIVEGCAKPMIRVTYFRDEIIMTNALKKIVNQR